MTKKRRKNLAKAVLFLAAVWLVQLIVFRFVPVLFTPHLLVQRAKGEPVSHKWVPLEEVSPEMIRAVIAAEDNRFCSHWGVDWPAMKIVWRDGFVVAAPSACRPPRMPTSG